MESAFGIHIGNTNASLAHCRGGHSEMVVNEAGDRMTPALVTITDEETIVGLAAKAAMISRWNTTVCNNKSFLKIDDSNHEHLDILSNVEKVIKNHEIHYSIPLEGRVKYVTPKQIATCIFRKLYNTAKSSLNINEDNVSCVLLVPQNSTHESCENYKSSAEAAGWKVLQIINENAAAVLSYSLLESKEPTQTILVYRLGGTTCEVVGYDLTNGMLYALGSEHSEEIGGVKFTNILAEYLADEFFKKYKLDTHDNRRSMTKLKHAAENSIQVLSKMQTANCFIESLQDGVDFTFNVSRARFELLIQPLLNKFMKPIQLLLNKLDLDRPVDKVILCGGGATVPKLRSQITTLFDSRDTEILSHLNGDEVLASGAARQAYYLFNNGISEFLPRSEEIIIDE